jgi:hypothetical protein
VTETGFRHAFLVLLVLGISALFFASASTARTWVDPTSRLAARLFRSAQHTRSDVNVRL